MKVDWITREQAQQARQETQAALGQGEIKGLTDEQLVVLLFDVQAEIERRSDRRRVSPGVLLSLTRRVEGERGPQG